MGTPVPLNPECSPADAPVAAAAGGRWPDLLVIHTAELLLKGKNRPFFERRLKKNILHALADIGQYNLQRCLGSFSILLETPHRNRELSDRLRDLPGIDNFYFAYRLPLDCAALFEAVEALARPRAPVPFAIRCRRSLKTFPISSLELNRQVGSRLVARGWPVNLTAPEITFHVDMVPGMFLLYTDVQRGPGGLPVGVAGRVVALISGGIDSPVAARLIAARGCEIVYAHFQNLTPHSGAVTDKIRRIVGVLQKSMPPTRLYLVPFRDLQRRVVAGCPAPSRMLIYRRMMMRIGALIARGENAGGLVTGDSIGQVASQTVDNLGAIHGSAGLPVFSPLIGLDKRQIMSLARRYGTYELSILPYPDCCSMLSARHPEIGANAESLRQIEIGADFAPAEETAWREAEIVEV